MQDNRDRYLGYLNQYLTHMNVDLRSDGQMRCPNSAQHKNNDKKFSAKFYENKKTGHQRIECFGCGFKGDIYDMVGFYNNENEFNKQFEIIDNSYGSGELSRKQEVESYENNGEIKPVSLSLEVAKKTYSEKNVNNCRSYSKDEITKNGEIKAHWFYTDIDNNIIACDVRFEGKEKLDKNGVKKVDKKTPTFWFNGKNVKLVGSVSLVYNLYDSLQSDKPILIHEGPKCGKLGKDKIEGLESVAYNRGANSSGKPDWSVYKNRQIYILQDNDKQGMKGALTLKSKLPHAIILKTIYSQFEIEDIDGADIEQLLEQATPEKIEQFILNYDENEQEEYTKNKKPEILGIDDNNNVFFIDRFQRLFSTKRNQLQKNNLMVISNLDYWMLNYPGSQGRINWDDITDDILEESSKKEFDSTKIRGRGAWSEGKNLIYHDGKNTQGETSGEFMYLRKNRRDIGINEETMDFKTMIDLRKLCNHVSFEKTSDLIRLLSWSLISPFAGALKWRPGLLLTGESGSGKTEVLEKISLPINNGKHYNAHYSTTAGIKNDVGKDSCAVCLEEAEANQNNNGFDKNQHRNNLFALMRSSSSDDAPEGVKSNSEQGVVKSQMKNMFLFVSITPTISDVADENRIFKVNFVKPEKKKTNKKWEEVEKELKAILTKENCKKIRALVWSKLPKIIDDLEIVKFSMKYDFKKTSRIADGESILISTYINIFKDFEVNKENTKEFLEGYYKETGDSEERDEASELLKKIFDEIIEIKIEKNSKKLSIKECLDCLKYKNYDDFYDVISYTETKMIEKEKLKIISFADKEIKRTLGHYGLSFTNDSKLAISNNNDRIKRILSKEDGYGKLFQRHKDFVLQPNGKFDKPVSINKQSQRAVIINIYKNETIELLEEEEETIGG